MDDLNDGVSPDRRDFLRTCAHTVAGVVAAGLALPVLQGCEVSEVLTSDVPSVFDVSTLTADNQALITATNGPQGTPLVIVRRSATQYSTLSLLCTHQGCIVGAPANGELLCPCHGSRYDLTGAVKNGPAVQPLASYPTAYDAGTGTVKVTFS